MSPVLDITLGDAANPRLRRRLRKLEHMAARILACLAAVALMATTDAVMPCTYEVPDSEYDNLLAFKNEVHTGKSAGTALYTEPGYMDTARQWGDPGKPIDTAYMSPDGGCICYNLFGVECSRSQAPPEKDSRYVISIDLPCPGVYPNKTTYDIPLNGVLPEAAADLVYLESLTLTGNALTGTLPDSWSVLTRLKALRLAGNKLTGTVPSSWSNMESLTYLDLSGNPMACYYQPEWLLEWGMKASNTLRITEPALCTGYRPPKRSPPSLPPPQPEPPGLPPPLRKPPPPITPPPVAPAKPPPVVVAPKTTPPAPAPPPEPQLAAPTSSFPVAAAAVPAVLGSVAILSAAGWVLVAKYGGLAGVSELFSSLTSGFGKPFGGAGAGAGSSFMGGPEGPSPFSPAPAPAAPPPVYYSTPSPAGLAYPPAAAAPNAAGTATRAAASYAYTAAAAAADPALLNAPAAGSSSYYIPAAEQAMYSAPPPAPSPPQVPAAPAPPAAPPATTTMPTTQPPNLTPSGAGSASTYLERAASGASYSDPAASAMPPPSAPSSQLLAAPSSGTDPASMVADGLDMLSKGLDHGPGHKSSMLSSGTSVLSSAITLATNGGDLLSQDTLDLVMDLVGLAQDVREASQRVDANHARCKLLAERIQV